MKRNDYYSVYPVLICVYFYNTLFWFMFEVGFFLIVFMIKFEKNI